MRFDIEAISKHTLQMNLLLVEDEPIAQEATKILLENFFANIHTASTAQEGIDIIEHQKIDLIITDITMPGLDGLYMIEQIKKKYSKIPVIILSARTQPHYFLKSIALEVEGYLQKPVDIDNMFELLETIVTQKQNKPSNTALQYKKNEILVGTSYPARLFKSKYYK